MYAAGVAQSEAAIILARLFIAKDILYCEIDAGRYDEAHNSINIKLKHPPSGVGDTCDKCIT